MEFPPSEIFAQQGKIKLEIILNDEQIMMEVIKCGVVGVDSQFHQVGSKERNIIDKEVRVWNTGSRAVSRYTGRYLLWRRRVVLVDSELERTYRADRI